MKRTLLVAGMLIAVCSLVFGQKPTPTDRNKDQEALKQIVQDLTEAVAHSDTDKLNQLQADNFQGTGGGLSLSKTVLHNAWKPQRGQTTRWTRSGGSGFPFFFLTQQHNFQTLPTF